MTSTAHHLTGTDAAQATASDTPTPGAWVSDVVYRPLETELIRRSLAHGHPVLDGGRMAVGQACASLRIITGVEPDRERMHRHFRALVSAEERAARGGSAE